jgi:hypothetical protein
MREYSTVRPSYNGHENDLHEMCRIGLIVEYSRMQVPSLSRGWIQDEIWIFEKLFKGGSNRR